MFDNEPTRTTVGSGLFEPQREGGLCSRCALGLVSTQRLPVVVALIGAYLPHGRVRNQQMDTILGFEIWGAASPLLLVTVYRGGEMSP